MTHNFYRTCSPAVIISENILEAKKVTVTCGGGIGGSVWHEYIINGFEALVKSSGPAAVTDIDYNEIYLNPAYIVKAETVKVVILIEDVSKHDYFNPKHLPCMGRVTMYEIGPEDLVRIHNEHEPRGYSGIKPFRQFNTPDC